MFYGKNISAVLYRQTIVATGEVSFGFLNPGEELLTTTLNFLVNQDSYPSLVDEVNALCEEFEGRVPTCWEREIEGPRSEGARSASPEVIVGQWVPGVPLDDAPPFMSQLFGVDSTSGAWHSTDETYAGFVRQVVEVMSRAGKSPDEVVTLGLEVTQPLGRLD